MRVGRLLNVGFTSKWRYGDTDFETHTSSTGRVLGVRVIEVAADVTQTTQTRTIRSLLRPARHEANVPHAPRIAVWGHYYGPNLGDELVTSTVIQAIRARRPEAKVCAISLNPEDTRARHGVPAYPLNRSNPRTARHRGWRRYPVGLLRRLKSGAREIPHLWSSYRLMRDVDLLVVAGSGQLLDEWSGPWGHPYAIFKWSWLARLTGARFAILSVGAGPLQGRLARYFIRAAVEHAEYISLREESAIEVLRAAGVTRHLPLCPDMGLALPIPDAAMRPARPPGSSVVVGLNAMAHAHPDYWGRGDLVRYERYRDKLLHVVNGLLEDGATVRLFSSHAMADAVIADDLIAAVRANRPHMVDRLEHHRPTEVDQLVEFVGDCDVVIGTRYHSVVLPMLMGVPTIGVAYHPKTVGVMAMAQQSEFCFPDIDAFEAERLLECTCRVIRDSGTVRASLAANIPALREAVERQFDEVFSTGSGERVAHASDRAHQTERGRHVA